MKKLLCCALLTVFLNNVSIGSSPSESPHDNGIHVLSRNLAKVCQGELRLLCGSHPAVFMTAMERFYFEAAHSQFGYKIARVAQRTMSETTGTGPKVIAR